MPDCYCSVCTSVRYGREPSCADCGAPRPGRGWPPLSTCDDNLLGRTVDRRFFVTRRITRFGQAKLYRVGCLTVAHDFGLWVCPVESFECDRETLYDRMEREVRAQRQLELPNVVPIHEFLELPNGCAAVVMDYVDGPPLHSLGPKGVPLRIGRACELGAQIARALREAHASGLVHRQLIPHNIIVEQKHHGSEQVRLLNFGLSRLMSEAEDEDARHFLSPEQGRGAEPDQRSNLYGMGALLFFLLTGYPPASEWNTAGTWGVRQNRAPRVSEVLHDVKILGPLDNLIFKLLSPKVPERPDSLSSVIPILEVYADAGVAFESGDEFSDLDDLDTASIANDLTNTGNYFNTSARTSVFSPAHLQAPTTGSVSQLSLSKTLESRPSLQELPDDLDPRNSVSFWLPDEQNTNDVAWVNTISTGGRKKSRPTLPPIVCATRATDGFVVVVDEGAKLWRGKTLTLQDFEAVGSLDERALAIAASAKTVLVGQPDGKLVAIDRATQERRTLLETIDRAPINSVKIGERGERVVAAAESGRVYLGQLSEIARDDDWERVRSKQPVEDIALAAGAQTLGVLRSDGTVELRRDAAPHTLLASFQAPAGSSSMALSADGQLVALVSSQAVHLIHGYSGHVVATFDALSHSPVSAYFEAGNDLFGICQADGELLIWNLATNSPVEARAASTTRD